jgi:hypothetical protein
VGAAFGWGWLLELLEVYGFEPHMVHPLQCKAIASAQPIRAILADHGHGRRRGKKIATTRSHFRMSRPRRAR